MSKFNLILNNKSSTALHNLFCYEKTTERRALKCLNELSAKDIKNYNLEFSIIEDDPDSWFGWEKAYYILVKPEGEEKTKNKEKARNWIEINKKELGLILFVGNKYKVYYTRKEAEKLVKKMQYIIEKKEQEVIFFTYPELKKTDPTQIDPVTYQQQASDLQKENEIRLTNLRTITKENIARIGRLNKIQQALEKAKIASTKIKEQEIQTRLNQQQQSLDFVEHQISEISEKWKKVKEKDNDLADRLNSEYLDLKKKQFSILTVIESLKKCSEFVDISQLNLESLYNPSFSEEILTDDHSSSMNFRLIFGIFSFSFSIFIAIMVLYNKISKDRKENSKNRDEK